MSSTPTHGICTSLRLKLCLIHGKKKRKNKKKEKEEEKRKEKEIDK